MNPNLTRYLFNPVYKTVVYGPEYYKLIDFYQKSQFKSIEKIQEYQLSLVISLLNHAYKNTGYYNNLFKGLNLLPAEINNLNDLNSIPLLERQLVRENFNSITARNIETNRAVKNSTSGSTGENLYFLSDKASFIRRSAMQVRMDEYMGLHIGDKIIVLWGTQRDIRSNKLNVLKKSILNENILSAFNMSVSDMFNYFNVINSYKPSMIRGFPSILDYFADFLNKNNLSYHPKSIRTEGEPLDDFQRAKLESTFGCPVFSFYSSRDIPAIAHECNNHSGLHIQSDNVVLEVINDKGISITEGEGDIVLTDLHNYVMPFIRYRNGDRGIISTRKCTCGINFPLIEKVTGRTLEVIKFPNGNSVAGTFWPLIIKSIVRLNKFQVIQKSPNQIIINMIPDTTISSEEMNAIKLKIHEFSGSELEIVFNIVDNIPLTKGGKHRFVIIENTI